MSRRALAAAAGLALGLHASAARAATLDGTGRLVFDEDALLTVGFESLPEAQAQGAAWVSWNASDTALVATAVGAVDWVPAPGSSAPGAVYLPGALEGTHALELTAGSVVGLAIVDAALFQTLTSRRIQVSFWGFSMGAEPELDVVYPSTDQPFGPYGFGHVVAIRTGQETSDGWAEYSTGPIDGQIFGSDPVAALILTARFPATDGIDARDSSYFNPPESAEVLDSAAYALADAVEIEPVAGAPTPPTACTHEDLATACGPHGECVFGHCIDSSVVWGAVPAPADQVADLVRRWAFVAQHLGGDRGAATRAGSVFSPSAVSALTSGATPLYRGLNALVAGVRDGHTELGFPPSAGTALSVGMAPFNATSGILDLCFGLAEDDVGGTSASPVYAVFWVAPDSPVGAAKGGTLAVGDVLTAVDGLSPDAWLDAVGPSYRDTLPNDPRSEPAGRALFLATALGKYASTAELSSCDATGACTKKTLDVGALTFAIATGKGPSGATAGTRRCMGRFTDAVSTWTAADDALLYDLAAFESVGGVASVEMDGFHPAADDADRALPYPTWQTPWTQALTSGEPLLVDARYGHGGYVSLIRFVTHQIRGPASPYSMLAMPRGEWDDIDPAWTTSPGLAACVGTSNVAPDLCGWATSLNDASPTTTPVAAGVKIAWVDGYDVSANDITPRDLQGAPNVVVFGGLPTTGAYGEISELPPLAAGWTTGAIQVTDARFGSSFDAAVASPWASGTGVVPDQVVLQKVSDLLAGTDTVLAAARAWLTR